MEVPYEIFSVHVKSHQISHTDIILHDHIYLVNIKNLPLNYAVSTYMKKFSAPRCKGMV
jgi:hypothetical protein